MHPAARQNSAAGANDPGSLPGKVLRARRVRCSFEKNGCLLKDLDHPIDFLARVVKIETRPRRTGHAETAHQWLVAMMTTAHGEAIAVGERREIVRMRRIHDEADNSGVFFGGAKY